MGEEFCPTCLEAGMLRQSPGPHACSGDAEMQALVGRTVFALLVDPPAHTLYVVTDAGALAFGVEGDCCSESWYADILGVAALRGEAVLGARELEMPQPENGDPRTRQEFDAAYGVELRTARGRCTIAFRNSSNGYYGGWMRDPEPVDVLPAGLREIADDWSA